MNTNRPAVIDAATLSSDGCWDRFGFRPLTAATPAVTSLENPHRRLAGESAVDFGRRAIATVVLKGAGLSPTVMEAVDRRFAEWLAPRVVGEAAHLNRLRNRSCCGCSTSPGEVITAALWTRGGHECTHCSDQPGLPAQRVAADCQRCVRDLPSLLISPWCDRCRGDGQDDDRVLVAGAGDVNVVVRVCSACFGGHGGSGEGLSCGTRTIHARA